MATRMTIAKVLDQIRRGADGKAELSFDDFRTLYERFCQETSINDAPVTVVRTAQVLMCQFSGHSKFRILIEDNGRAKGEDDFKFIESLGFIDPPAFKQSLYTFVRGEIKAHLKWVRLLCGCYLVVALSLDVTAGLTNLFSVTSQAISVFVAVFVVFTTTQVRQSRLNIDLFIGGHLSKYFAVDRNLTWLSILTIVVSLLGTVIGNARSPLEWNLVVSVVTITLEPVTIIRTVMGLAVLVGLLILFCSLPEYYFKRSAEMTFAEHVDEILNRHYDIHHKKADLWTRPIRGPASGENQN